MGQNFLPESKFLLVSKFFVWVILCVGNFVCVCVCVWGGGVRGRCGRGVVLVGGGSKKLTLSFLVLREF